LSEKVVHPQLTTTLDFDCFFVFFSTDCATI